MASWFFTDKFRSFTSWLTRARLMSSHGDWELISLPAIATTDERFPRVFGNRVVRRQGEALHPIRENRAQLRQALLQMGAQAFMAQYQQEPYPRGEGDERCGAFHCVSHPDATEEECKESGFFLSRIPEERFVLEKLFGEFSGIRAGPPPPMTDEEWEEWVERYQGRVS